VSPVAVETGFSPTRKHVTSSEMSSQHSTSLFHHQWRCIQISFLSRPSNICRLKLTTPTGLVRCCQGLSNKPENRLDPAIYRSWPGVKVRECCRHRPLHAWPGAINATNHRISCQHTLLRMLHLGFLRLSQFCQRQEDLELLDLRRQSR
jgi:hypothetical protein